LPAQSHLLDKGASPSVGRQRHQKAGFGSLQETVWRHGFAALDFEKHQIAPSTCTSGARTSKGRKVVSQRSACGIYRVKSRYGRRRSRLLGVVWL
jgi:hypothetical protein